ncbi:DUF202 domain-containing protein [Nocardia flavorosea]|uniref:DUF202 domain-containing protein n=1 Tax=Nocardia flavorosea TaxID=53429 RepID=A0A846YSJ7_9NOCA|nr:DUF202 domain-containing protein [Nocardia flavorosea]NKY59949.1 DUF202 domain-containing protein [Nocardia flavorosea]
MKALRPRGQQPTVVLTDGGLQLERTALAWRRTGCSLLICELAAFRVMAELDQGFIAVLFLAAVAPTLVIMLSGSSRPATAGHSLAEDEREMVYSSSSTGLRELLLALLVALSGALCLLVLCSGAAAGWAIGESG